MSDTGSPEPVVLLIVPLGFSTLVYQNKLFLHALFYLLSSPKAHFSFLFSYFSEIDIMEMKIIITVIYMRICVVNVHVGELNER